MSTNNNELVVYSTKQDNNKYYHANELIFLLKRLHAYESFVKYEFELMVKQVNKMQSKISISNKTDVKRLEAEVKRLNRMIQEDELKMNNLMLENIDLKNSLDDIKKKMYLPIDGIKPIMIKPKVANNPNVSMSIISQKLSCDRYVGVKQGDVASISTNGRYAKVNKVNDINVNKEDVNVDFINEDVVTNEEVESNDVNVDESEANGDNQEIERDNNSDEDNDDTNGEFKFYIPTEEDMDDMDKDYQDMLDILQPTRVPMPVYSSGMTEYKPRKKINKIIKEEKKKLEKEKEYYLGKDGDDNSQISSSSSNSRKKNNTYKVKGTKQILMEEQKRLLSEQKEIEQKNQVYNEMTNELVQDSDVKVPEVKIIKNDESVIQSNDDKIKTQLNNIDKLKVVELKSLAKDMKLKGYHKFKKQELINFIKQAQKI